MGYVELDEQDRIVFVFPEQADTDGAPRRVPLTDEVVMCSEASAESHREFLRTIARMANPKEFKPIP